MFAIKFVFFNYFHPTMKILIILFLFAISDLNTVSHDAASTDPDTEVLLGLWKLDMSPHIQDDDNFAMMRITRIEGSTFEGTFYRDGVSITEGRLNTQRGIIYGALVSGDGSGEYNTTFYYENGKLYGSTHAIQRQFLSVWIATKEKK